ncbi:1-phosphofructokinase family hexose kinase [Streptosporangium sp. NPDC000396]|uniref:1-phosphofructokinase family hexose kinase n=1 Tax=Streptosporangium sp. NPDC000396 TaxID=3366185 RepID=UPI0036782771
MTSSPAPHGTILTVTLNLALDVTYMTENVDWDGVNRVRTVHRRAGGKGVNVARVLADLGRDVLVTGLSGGPTGRAAEADLAAAGLPAALTPIAAESRSTLAVCDLAPAPGTVSTVGGAERAARRTALFNEPGPVVTEAELERFLHDYDTRLGRAATVVISGSLPRGVPAGFYAELAARARERGVPAIVDADGEPLRHAPAGRPSIVKPNAEELSRALALESALARGDGGPAASGEVLETETLRHDGASPTGRRPSGTTLAGAAMLRQGGAESVVVSLGADGLLAVTPEGAWRAAMPYRVEGNPTGAGDALVAGLALGLVEGMPWPDRLRRAAALGAAAVAAPVAGEVDRETFQRIHPGIRVEALHP